MATSVMNASRNVVRRRPVAVWTTVAGGCGFIAGYWTCAHRRKVAERSAFGVQQWQWLIGGLTCGIVLLGGGTLLTRRFLYPNPESIFHSVLPKLRASQEVCELVGHHMQPGLFRAYSRFGGRWKWFGAPPFIKWTSRGLEVMFQVNGEAGSGMVSARVVGGLSLLQRKEPVYQSLAVDLPTGERVILKGTPDQVVFKGYTRLR